VVHLAHLSHRYLAERKHHWLSKKYQKNERRGLIELVVLVLFCAACEDQPYGDEDCKECSDVSNCNQSAENEVGKHTGEDRN
jgi:hypothetical protein